MRVGDLSTTATITVRAAGDTSLQGQTSYPAAVQGQGIPADQPLATFYDPVEQDPTNFSATISWGDGNSSAGVVARVDEHRWNVYGSYTYAHPGNYTVSITITPSDPLLVLTGTLAVANAPVQAGLVRLGPTAGQLQAGPLAWFWDEYAGSAAAGFTASIVWEAGQAPSTTYTIMADSTIPGLFWISDTYTYATAGTKSLVVTISEHAGAQSFAVGTLTSSVEVQPAAVPAMPTGLVATALSESQIYLA